MKAIVEAPANTWYSSEFFYSKTQWDFLLRLLVCTKKFFGRTATIENSRTAEKRSVHTKELSSSWAFHEELETFLKEAGKFENPKIIKKYESSRRNNKFHEHQMNNKRGETAALDHFRTSY